MLYEQIAHNKRNTWIVMILFSLVILVIAYLFASMLDMTIAVIFLVAGITYLTYTYFYAMRHLMTVTHAVQVRQHDNPQLFELVEELCLASGMTIPEIYIIPNREPNAFATGRDPQHASLAVTDGLLKMMNKNEVQGVIGHELSHIRNYDTRVTTISSGLVNLIIKTGLGIVSFSWAMICDNDQGLLGLLIKFLAGFLLMIGGVITLIGIPIAKLLYFAVSRQREYLADAGSVELTREPSGLISALTKLQHMSSPQRSRDMMVNALSFNTPLSSHFIVNLFADHPTLEKRIKRLKNSASI
ncbi:M48 family metallopeptidase [uncultured Limosilactobacillus sp.]|uniref:M48 family metallopeptidase n=1 Tax=uncultured Limosilactobacillus sp. TaxID=2837629 RepID=UPI0025DA9404|nr:M48 family metallopeptidase [uncultured Limosilactobacillus sp.]